MRRSRSFTLTLDRRLLLCLALACAPALAACQDDTPPCERCEFVFYWDSNGALSDSSESCHKLADCADAICGLCFDISYNTENLPISGTCDSCDEEKDCGIINDPTEPAGYYRRCYYPTHPTECAARGVSLEDCGCYDPKAPGSPC